ncbi:hypothetical protein V3851_00155 [Paenibacillus sp. M1]|uniref:Zinc ribbon domain-containing protein n=1 Tax=Paenibacillus haidiansis TaxID=1574488 RepID=A0ABU7VKD2_9BACL
MKTVKLIIGILMAIFASFFLLLGFIFLFDEEGPVLSIIFFLTPGALLVFGSVKMLQAPKKMAASQPNHPNQGGPRPNYAPGPNQAPRPRPGVPPQAFQPYDAKSVNDFVQQQIKQESNKNKINVDINVGPIIDTFFGAAGGFANEATAAAAKEPVSLDCPGCGAKTAVYPGQTANCEFCGTVVPYKAK